MVRQGPSRTTRLELAAAAPLKDYDTFTLIDILSNKGETRFSPPATTDVHGARPYATLEETEIWKIARCLATVLNDLPTLACIERSAFVGRDALKTACDAYTSYLTANLERRGNEWFRWAPHAVVEAYLRFEVPGVVAAVCLASVLNATVEILCEQAGCAESIPRFERPTHPILRTWRIGFVPASLMQREPLTISCRTWPRSIPSPRPQWPMASPTNSTRCGATPSRGLLLNSEEKSCYLINPTLFAFPARLSTVGILMYMVCYCHLLGKSMAEAIALHNLHPTLAAGLQRGGAMPFPLPITEPRAAGRGGLSFPLPIARPRVAGR